MTTWEQKFIRFAAERWVFQGSDPHDFTPRTMILALGEDFLSPLLDQHEHFGALYSGVLAGRRVGYMRIPPGTVILEGVMRSLVYTRVDTVIGLGSCGALQPGIECGDIVVSGASQAGEGLSPHYGFPIGEVVAGDAGLTAGMAGFMSGRGLPVHEGPIVTTGAAFRETDEMIAAWSEQGFLGVELEASALFSLGDFLGLKTAVALLVTDSPIRKETSNILHGPKREAFVNAFIDYLGSAE
ncbi:MAG: phosphorylase family protein [Thermoleophilia bacterium]